MKTLKRTAALAALAVLGLGIGVAPPAPAHVKVSLEATLNDDGVLTFWVPTESDDASTTELRVTLPDDPPIYFVDTQPKPGWTATLTKKDLPAPQTDENGTVHKRYVTQVDWKADNPQAAVPHYQFDSFSIEISPLPKQATLTLPAEQFYSDGQTVNWNEPTVAGQPAPEHPAPVLDIASSTTTQTPAGQGTPTWLGITALAVAVVALLLGVGNLAGLRRGR